MEKKKDFKNWIYWVIVLIMLLLGVFLLFIDAKFCTSGTITSSILNKSATAIIITGLFSLLNNLILRQNLMALIYEKTNLKQGIDKAGVINLYANFLDIDYRSYFENCKKDIDILHVYGQTWTANYEHAIIKAINKKKCKVRVIILNPNSSFISGLADFYGYSEIKLKDKIDETVKTWTHIQSKINGKAQKKKLQVYQVNMFPSFSMYRFDDKIIKVDNRLISSGKTMDLNSIIIQDNGYSPTYYTNCMRDFNNLLADPKTNQLL